MFKNKKEFYNSDEFNSLKEYLTNERKNPDDGMVYCEHCGRPIVKKYDMVAHHKKELTDQNINDYMISLNPELIVLVHFKCHNEIHRRFGKEGYRRHISFMVHRAEVRQHSFKPMQDRMISLSIWTASIR